MLIFIKYKSKIKYIILLIFAVFLIFLWNVIFEDRIIKFNHYSDIGEYVLPYQKKIFYIRGDNYIFAFYNDHRKYNLKHFINEDGKWIVLKSYFEQETTIKKYDDYTILVNEITDKGVALVSVVYPTKIFEEIEIKDNYDSEFRRRKFSLSEKDNNYIEYVIVDINDDYQLLVNGETYTIFK